MNFSTLKTDRLTLNALTEKDTEALFQHFSDPDVVKYYDLSAFTELAQAEKLIALFNKRFEEELGIRWAIRLQENNQFIGTCGFNSWKPAMKSAVIGYDISKPYWGNGYVTEALRAVLNFAFLGGLPCGELNRIQGDTVPGNDASETVLRKLGFKEEGLLRQSGYWKGEFHDLKCFGLIREEFTAV